MRAGRSQNAPADDVTCTIGTVLPEQGHDLSQAGQLVPPSGPVGAAAVPFTDLAAEVVARDEVVSRMSNLPRPPVGEDGALTANGKPAPKRVGTGAGGGKSMLRVIGRGFSWVTAYQLIMSAGNLLLTPFVIHGMGVERYGLLIMVISLIGFVGTFNGGLIGTANRYFPIYAGRDDRVATTRLLVSFLLLVLAFGVVAGVIDWFVSPVIVRLLSMSPSLRPETVFLFRTIAILVTFGFAHMLVQAVITARQRFDRAVQAGLACYAIWVGGLVWVVHDHGGLRGVALIFIVQQVATVAFIGPTSLRYLTRKSFSLLSWQELKPLFAFSGKLQVAGIANIVNSELDTLVIGSGLSVTTVGVYNVGANFAQALSLVAGNALGPASVRLGNTYGREGPEEAFKEYENLQHIWVVAVSGWSAVGMAAAYFGATAWLGPSFKLASWVAVVSILASVPWLLMGMVSLYMTLMRRAGLEMRYGLVAMALNVVLAIPAAFLGAVAVVGATGVAQLLSAAYLFRLARRKLRPDLPN
ncbi:MAG TPA: lipopolysaccharide biosynthesis protein, partial [Acidimicrobiales bacterium]|nr:lipopolysaccharide biosynthesis protein [Acidimicrobiales bacterium]